MYHGSANVTVCSTQNTITTSSPATTKVTPKLRSAYRRTAAAFASSVTFCTSFAASSHFRVCAALFGAVSARASASCSKSASGRSRSSSSCSTARIVRATHHFWISKSWAWRTHRVGGTVRNILAMNEPSAWRGAGSPRMSEIVVARSTIRIVPSDDVEPPSSISPPARMSVSVGEMPRTPGEGREARVSGRAGGRAAAEGGGRRARAAVSPGRKEAEGAGGEQGGERGVEDRPWPSPSSPSSTEAFWKTHIRVLRASSEAPPLPPPGSWPWSERTKGRCCRGGRASASPPGPSRGARPPRTAACRSSRPCGGRSSRRWSGASRRAST